MSTHPWGFEEDVDWDKPPPDSRSGSRQVALQALYWEASSPGTAPAAVDDLSKRFELSPETALLAADLVRRAVAHEGELEGLIAAKATNWEQSRIARIDGIILRLALAEILYVDDIPVRVSIDEAIELAKLFSTEKSFGFVNGILDAIVHQKGLEV